jgi:nitroimidazol reductase NimA-like FMN-containing flavoprotein (pyridoxamine 5'-phosphate oxidase superfamily)
MDADAAKLLNKLIHKERMAHLGTLRDGAPLVSMTLFVPESDFSIFYLHISRLAWHTQDLQRDGRCSLSIAQTDDGRPDPFTFPRVIIRGEAQEIPNEDEMVPDLKIAWTSRFPRQEPTFQLADFSFWRIVPRDARFIAGYGGIHNLSPADLVHASR